MSHKKGRKKEKKKGQESRNYREWCWLASMT